MAAESQASEPLPKRSGPRRRLWAPEIVQTSAMDCGPAALKCLLEGFGIPVSYGRLREACQTSVDGTSIDTLEETARALGLDAEQVMVPVEHVIAPAADLLPAIAVVRLPSGMTHFVVLWRRLGPYMQLMDPARGRRWVRASAFLHDLHVHTQTVDAQAFRAFVADAGFTAPLGWRIGQVVGTARVAALAPLFRAAETDASWRPMARLDGGARALRSLSAAGVIRTGAEADRLFRALLAPASPAHPVPGADDVLEAHSCAHDASAGTTQGEPTVRFSGAVLVRVAGLLSTASDRDGKPLSRELAAALGEHRSSLVRSLVSLWSPGARRLGILAIGLAAVAAVGGIAEVLLVRPLLSTAPNETGSPHRSAIAGLVLVCAVVFGLLGFEWPLALATRRLGRALDQGLRRAFLRKLPRLGDRYFASRPVSDMAERAHLLHRVRLLPGLAADMGRCWLQLGLMTVAIIWLYPGGAWIAGALLAFAIAVPLLGVPTLAERDLRLRTHAGSLMRFYLDALLGLSAVRTHRAERAVAAEHGVRLAEWGRAGRDMVRASLTVETAVVVVSALGAGALVIGSFGGAPSAAARGGAGLLLLFFALGLPTQAARLIFLWRQMPAHRSVILRLLEPLGAPDEGHPRGVHQDIAQSSAPESSSSWSAAAIGLESITVEAGGHVVLADVSLTIEPGSHVAVVGASGAGKSTLIGLFLGLQVPAAGRVLVDNRDLNDDPGCLAALRAVTAWVDPGVQLWNRSLAENVAYGADPPPSDDDVSRALADADLAELSAGWPRGVRTPLGEGGGLLSGGEGQRVRLARELVRVRRPRLVLLDEPFRGLDRDARRRLLARARARWAEATLIAATHDIAQTRDFTRVLVVAAGRIVEDGHPARLAADPRSLYRALLDGEARVGRERWESSIWRSWTVRDARVIGDEP